MASSTTSVPQRTLARKTFVPPHPNPVAAPVMAGLYRGMLLRLAGQPISACTTDGEARGYMFDEPAIEDDSDWIRTGC